jgi:hypothetical protein
MKTFISQAAEQLGVHVSVADIEKMPPIRHASGLLAQLGSSPDPVDLVQGARGALAPCRVAVLAGELAIADLVAQDIVPADAIQPAIEHSDPDTGITPSLMASASNIAAVNLQAQQRRKQGGKA